MGNKLILEHLKLKEKINNFNSERDIINQEKKKYNKLKKKEKIIEHIDQKK